MRRHLYFYTYLHRPFDEARVVFAGDPAAWLPAPAAVLDGGWAVTLDAGGVVPGALSTHAALVRVGDPLAGLTPPALRPITWRSANRDGLFPVLSGDLELAPLSDLVCQLSLIGAYRPPLSVVGAAADALVGHRVAEAVVRGFVLQTAERLANVSAPV